MENLLKRYPALEVCKDDIKAALKLIIETYENGGLVTIYAEEFLLTVSIL